MINTFKIVKRLGNSEGITLTPEEKKIEEIKEGDIIEITIKKTNKRIKK